MPKYRYKPVDIDAVQFDGKNWLDVTAHCGTREVDGHTMLNFSPIGTYLPFGTLTTPEHIAEIWLEHMKKVAVVKVGDWVVKGMESHLVLVDDRAFQRLFEKVEE